MLNIKLIIKVLGTLLFIEGIFMLLPLGVACIYQESDHLPFLYSALITLLTGAISISVGWNANKNMTKRDGFIIVTLAWIIFSFFGCLPYLFSNSISCLTNAFFETMSGFTTTGSTVIDDIDSLPHGILFWRSLTQWLGGMGIIVLSLAIFPIFGIGGIQLFSAEVTGPTTDKINPKIRQTAKNLWILYLSFTFLETILLSFFGMDFFDAINHSFTTMSSGGYSTKNISVAYWDSACIQYIIIFFMFFSGVNFSLTFAAITGNFGKMLKNEEFRSYLFIILGFTAIVFTGLITTGVFEGEIAFRNAIFQVVSIITTTGFATTDYSLWSTFLCAVLLALFFFGGSAGSTSGGIKIVRIVLLIKNSFYELRRLLHPSAVIPVRYNRRAVSSQIITNILAFFMTYIIIFFISTILFTLIEPDLEAAIGAVASSLGNIGPSFGNLGPASTFSHISNGGKWFLSFLMLLGRLELFTILVLLSPAFWKK